jgi:hypothetical protein
VLDQDLEHAERLIGDRHRDASASKLPRAEIELELSEAGTRLTARGTLHISLERAG